MSKVGWMERDEVLMMDKAKVTDQQDSHEVEPKVVARSGAGTDQLEWFPRVPVPGLELV